MSIKQLNRPLAIVVVGASGDLARRKIIPPLFSLYARDMLPARVAVFGYARSAFDHVSFRSRLSGSLACRYTPGHDCERIKQAFLERCFYVRGAYDRSDGFLDVYRLIRETFPDTHPDCLYYLAVPPSVFLDCADALGDSGMAQCGESPFWARAVVEKPFGHDRQSSDALVKGLHRVFREADTYRIDHYLGKEIVQNLLVLRFANSVFEPIWNHRSIERVEIDWRETGGVDGRASYFDRYGIIRDVVQNHLLQILALIGMDSPAGRSSNQIRDAKTALLRAIRPVRIQNVRLGQYGAGQHAGSRRRAYRDEDGVPADSRTPTFMHARLQVENARWRGVPFYITAGKGLDADRTEIRLVFRPPECTWLTPGDSPPSPNRLVIRVQPQEAIRLHVLTKEPGLSHHTARTELQLLYSHAFSQTIPDAYERLLLDVIQGDKSLFIRKDELAASWDVFTPLLHEIDRSKLEPRIYPFGSSDP